jgi:hypothetical protein
MYVYIGYTIVNAKNELDITNTDDTTIDDHCLSGRIWLDRGLAQAALDCRNKQGDENGPFALANIAVATMD